jgi:hypothetical protein
MASRGAARVEGAGRGWLVISTNEWRRSNRTLGRRSGIPFFNMSMTNSELLRLARAGASSRLADIEAERRTLLRNFPGLSAPSRPSASRKPRPAMSAAARKAVSLAQKRRWAAWRKKKGVTK